MNMTPLTKARNDAPLSANTSERAAAIPETSVDQSKLSKNRCTFATVLNGKSHSHEHTSLEHKGAAKDLSSEASLVEATESSKQDRSETDVKESKIKTEEHQTHQSSAEQALELSIEENSLQSQVVINSGGQELGRTGFYLQETPTVEQAGQPGSSSSRLILHIADLERIVASVRTQTTPQGRQEVTLELTRSVLEGLRIKLNCDKQTNQITAELIASSESTKAQLDVRASELVALLRSRGINLTNLKTSLGGDAPNHENSDGGAQQQQQQNESVEHLRRSPARRDSSTSPVDANSIDKSNGEAGTTYRA